MGRLLRAVGRAMWPVVRELGLLAPFLLAVLLLGFVIASIWHYGPDAGRVALAWLARDRGPSVNVALGILAVVVGVPLLLLGGTLLLAGLAGVFHLLLSLESRSIQLRGHVPDWLKESSVLAATPEREPSKVHPPTPNPEPAPEVPLEAPPAPMEEYDREALQARYEKAMAWFDAHYGSPEQRRARIRLAGSDDEETATAEPDSDPPPRRP